MVGTLENGVAPLLAVFEKQVLQHSTTNYKYDQLIRIRPACHDATDWGT